MLSPRTLERNEVRVKPGLIKINRVTLCGKNLISAWNSTASRGCPAERKTVPIQIFVERTVLLGPENKK